ncbi:MAG TPA: iron ABC transporter permease [Syntrophorhabdaceae bacterium]|nr:iron ABC transporter permease [Syntrophorhabdaceae bacterium]
MSEGNGIWRIGIIYIILLLLLVSAAIISLGYGRELRELINGFTETEGFGHVLRRIRIPRTILALLIGGSLSICGATLQSLLRNSLAEPYTLGISGGASLGITISVICSLDSRLSIFANPSMGFFGAMVSTAMVYILSKKRFFEPGSMVLFGIVISLVFSSVVFLLFSIMDPDRMHGIILWLMGDLSGMESGLIYFYIPAFLIPAFFLFFFSRELDVLSLGTEKAQYLGVSPQRMYKIFFILTSVLTGLCVSAAGIIGFVGLIVPHILRMIIHTGNRHMLTASYLAGAAFLLFSDVFSRYILYPVELPVGVVTGILGGITLLILLIKRK